MGHISLILVDRELMMRVFLQESIKELGGEVYTYESTDCLHFIEDIKPRVVLVDLATLHEGDNSFLDKIQPLRGEIKFYLFSFKDKLKEFNTLESGKNLIDGFLEKPISLEHLKEFLETELK